MADKIDKDAYGFSGKNTMNAMSVYLATRDIAGDHLVELGDEYPNLVVVDADMRLAARTSKFWEKYPDRAFNVGIMEQCEISIAAGLAHEGFIPFVYTMTPFLTMRACEQVRTDICYGHLTCILMGNNAGYSNGISGATHCGIEDCAIMSSFGGMSVLEPGDPWMINKMMDAAIKRGGPHYIRISREAETPLYPQDYEYEIGKALVPKDGDDGAFIASGPCVQWAMQASNIIEEKTGAKIRVVDCHTIKPIDKEAVASAAKTGRVVCVQDHIIYGGLGSHAATAIAEAGVGCKFKILGCPDQFVPLATPKYLYHLNEMDVDGLVKNMLSFL